MPETVCPIRRFALTADGWTPVIAPVACNNYAILGTDGGAAIWRCSDDANDQTQHKLSSNESYALVIAKHWLNEDRFKAGDTVTYLKADQGTETAIVEFIL